MKRLHPGDHADHKDGIAVAQEYIKGKPVIYGYVVRDRLDPEGRFIVVNCEGETTSGRYKTVSEMIGPGPVGLGTIFHFYQLFSNG